MLSILIPVYNFNCVVLVQELHLQCMALNEPFEILVLDDTSTQFKAQNRIINDLEGCQYIESTTHYGRAKIRNELGKRAQFDYLLFIDADALVDKPDFIQNYITNKDKAKVIIGGMKYSEHPPKVNALRWHYGSKREFIPAKKRNKTPYKSLISFNIMFKRSVFEKHSFDEGVIDIKRSGYGHEDTLLGMELKNNNIPVLHINNHLIHDYHETNEGFITNSLTAVEKYVSHQKFREKKVVKQIKIFWVFRKVEQLRMVGLLSYVYDKYGGKMKKKLFSTNPSIRLFDFYRLSYLSNYQKKNLSK